MMNWISDRSKEASTWLGLGLVAFIVLPLLSGVLGTTTLTWLNDDSDDLVVTQEFLDRRIENVMQLGRFLGKIKRTG